MNKINPTTTDYTMLGNLIDDSKEILKKCNIKAVEGVHYDFHTAKYFGLANYGQKKITINYYFFKACIKNNAIHQLQNTMIHEMLHLVADQIDPTCGHRGMWKQLACKVSNMTDYHITRLANAEKGALKFTEKPPKHIIKCEQCGHEYYYQRECEAVKAVRMGSPFVYCTKCKSKSLKVVK